MLQCKQAGKEGYAEFGGRPTKPGHVAWFKRIVPHRWKPRSISLIPIISLAVGASVTTSSIGWAEPAPRSSALVSEILNRIRPPQFSDRNYPITDFGAKNDGVTDCQPAFRLAIAACSQAGGGRVVVPAGPWLVNGPIHLLSNVNLHLAEDAIVRFSPEPAHYLPNVLTRFEGVEVMNYSPLIYALEQQNIAITGSGALDGQASRANWWSWMGDANGDIKRLNAQAESGVPPESREYGEGHRLRPSFLQPYRCKHVLIEGVTIVNSPMWEIHPVLCENVTVRGVKIDSHGPNNDGCNPESCRDVLIEDCTFNTGDDCIAIKSGRNADGRRLNAPAENIVVRKCTMKDGHGGVTLGSEMSGGIRHVFVEDCSMSSPNLDWAIRLKSNSKRGGFLENLYVRNVRVGEVRNAALHIDLRYFNESGDHTPVVRNIVLENVTSERSQHPLVLLGIPAAPIQNVTLTACRFSHASKPSIIEHVDRLVLENVAQPGQ